MIFPLAYLLIFPFVTAAQNLDLLPYADSADPSEFLPEDDSSAENFMFSEPTATNLLDAGSTFIDATMSPSDLIQNVDDENLFATSMAGTINGESCQAEGIPPSILSPSDIGKRSLRVREEGKACTPKQRPQSIDENFLDQLPWIDSLSKPDVKEDPTVCPEKIYGTRIIPLCSSGYKIDETPVSIRRMGFILSHATPYLDYGCVSPQELWCCQSFTYLIPDSPGQIHDKPWDWDLTGFYCVKHNSDQITIDSFFGGF